jgi:hypothetical protein
MNLSNPSLPGNRLDDVRQPSLFAPIGVPQADPAAGKHHGAETSAQAHARVLPHKRAIYERVLSAVWARGADGATVHELAQDLETFPNNISGRLTELRILGRLEYRLDADGARVKRGGACVLVAAE